MYFIPIEQIQGSEFGKMVAHDFFHQLKFQQFQAILGSNIDYIDVRDILPTTTGKGKH